MSFLENLPDDERTKLVSLPYRVGLWVSKSDVTGGDEAETQELVVLSNIIHGFTDEMIGSEAVQEVMNETIAREDDWGKWADNLWGILEDCRWAVKIFHDHGGEKEVSAFAHHLMEIGEAVALAFQEEDYESSLPVKVRGYGAYYLAKAQAMIKNHPFRSMEEYFAISAKEREALQELGAVLGSDYI